jgi:hypothetical protein
MRVLCALALATVVTGCGSTPVERTQTPFPRPTVESPMPLPTGALQVGVPYQYRLYTHCGLRPVELEGTTWTVMGVLSDGNANPPPGFGNPFDDGTLWLFDPDHAVFQSSQGAERELTRGGLPPSDTCL